jgi:DNA-binding MarR family transcriptional regulator
MTMADDATPALLKTKPTWLISQVSARAHAVMVARLGVAGARGYHFRVLAALAEFGPASQAAVGRRADMDRSDVTATVTELARAGLVDRAADAGDRRRNVVTITGAGLARLRELDGILAAVQDEVLAPLSAAERSVLTGLLTRVLDGAVGAVPPAKGA